MAAKVAEYLTLFVLLHTDPPGRDDVAIAKVGTTAKLWEATADGPPLLLMVWPVKT